MGKGGDKDDEAKRPDDLGEGGGGEDQEEQDNEEEARVARPRRRPGGGVSPFAGLNLRSLGLDPGQIRSTVFPSFNIRSMLGPSFTNPFAQQLKDMQLAVSTPLRSVIDFNRMFPNNVASQNLFSSVYRDLAKIDFSQLPEKAFRAQLPENLRRVKPEFTEDDILAVLSEGFPLYEVPRSSICNSLIGARSAQDRREIIGRRFDAIVDDCEEALGRLIHPGLQYEVSSLRSAIRVLRAGETEAGQALASVVLDTFVWSLSDRRKLLGSDIKVMEDYPVRQYVALVPVFVAHTHFPPRGAVPVPRMFNRHASLHRVSRRQYSKRNAGIALMMAVGVGLHLGEEAS